MNFAGDLRSVFSNNRDNKHNYTFKAPKDSVGSAGLSSQVHTKLISKPVDFLATK